MPRRPADVLRAAWRRLSRLPGGTHVFAGIIARTIPYTGTVRPHVVALEPGYARVEMRDRRRIRNHLRSIHAIALANVGELATGLATTMALPADVDGILTGLSVEFRKKARGTVTAECRTSPPAVHEPVEHVATAEVRDAAGDVVAVVRATWRLRPAAHAR
jgi:acyl-coenzyme A thioesterase PaaI-like protein